jgi:uncharacterized membrane protein
VSNGNDKVDVARGSEPADPVSAPAGVEAGPTQDFVAAAATVGVIAAGVALFEVALIPGMVIGGAAVLAPKVLPELRRRLQPLLTSSVGERGAPPVSPPGAKLPAALPARLALKQAVVKTITFRIIVTTLEFTANYVVLGELATAAGLSAFALVVGPVFYFVHETAWNYYGPAVEGGTTVKIPVHLTLGPDGKAPPAGWGGFTINRALAKTITFRTIATAMDFTANYVVVGEFATAVALSAFGFVLGPFVYLGHEMAWDHYGSRRERTADMPSPASPVPAPG